MYRRFIILSAIILAAMGGLVWLGHHSIRIWAQGMEGARLGEFAAVAEQIRQDVKSKLDQFLRQEQNRPYTDYLSYYVPENIVADQSAIRLADQQQIAVLRSPLNGRLENDFAYGNFQIEPDGTIITPNDDIAPIVGGANFREISPTSVEATSRIADFNDDFYVKVQTNRFNIKNNLLPVLGGAISGSFAMDNAKPVDSDKDSQLELSKEGEQIDLSKEKTSDKKGGKAVASRGERGKNYPIESLLSEQKTQVIEQRRSTYEHNITSNAELSQQRVQSGAQPPPAQAPSVDSRQEAEPQGSGRQTPGIQTRMDRQRLQQVDEANLPADRLANQPGPGIRIAPEQQTQAFAQLPQPTVQEELPETVQIRIEPFAPLVVPGENAGQSIFDGQVFLLRHVQIEDKHFLQGFQLNENKLVDEVKESAQRFMREGMGFELSQAKNASVAQTVAYTAVLDFGFGQLVLNLKEIDPARISKQMTQLRNWYLSIVTVVLLAVTLGLASLWHNARAQIKLAQKKDDFISAVSHELRTPLTSIRMYSEMLEKNWVKSQDKLTEYYRSMRQESERLSRLIENVLDFSRIQRKQKKYMFKVGDINRCVADVVEMMAPYATQRNFSIKTELGQLGQTAFDNDAITQIVVNLLDNAIKYACNAEDRTITVRTKSEGQFVLIEVEDHGPGVPHRQHKKVFEEFYRIGAEATRETTGTGLGLALVKKFAQAHNGFVEILTAKPTGAIFRVALSARD
jgi:signal transduction histidine kinase